MSLLVKNIGMLVGIDEKGCAFRCGKDLDEVLMLADAWLLTDGDRIAD